MDGAAIDSVTAFWLATAGGADALGIPAGRISAGYVFDAFVVDLKPTTVAASGLARYR